MSLFSAERHGFRLEPFVYTSKKFTFTSLGLSLWHSANPDVALPALLALGDRHVI